MKLLTPKQKQTMDFIKQFYLKHGYMPSLLEISKKFKIGYTSSAWQRIDELVKKGYIIRTPNRPRAIELKIENDITQFIANFNPRLFYSKKGRQSLIEIIKDYQKQLK